MQTGQLEETLLPKTLALPIFASDPLSSVAYATESALVVLLAVSATSAHLVFPISIAIAALLAIVVVSYMQTVRAYETSGGAYIVARENLGTLPSLVGAAALLTDYVLTVAVSISAGIFAITSFAPSLAQPQGRALARAACSLIVLANLRGVRESGLALRAARRISSSTAIGVLVVVGARRARDGPRAPRGRAARAAGRHRRDHALRPPARVLVRARRRSPASRRSRTASTRSASPHGKNAAATLAILGAIAISLFLGVSYLAVHLHARPSATDVGRLADRARRLPSRLGRRASCTTPSRA